MITTAYEQLTSSEYWEAPTAEPVPELGWLAAHADVWLSKPVGADVEDSFYELKAGDVRTVLVEPGEVLPRLDPARLGLLRIILDERQRRQDPDFAFAIPTPAHTDRFNIQARYMKEERFSIAAPAEVTVPLLGTNEGFAISRRLIYARTALSERQLVGIPAMSADAVSEEEQGRTPRREPRLVIPRYKVGSVYRDEVDGMPRERIVSHAEVITPLNNVQEKDRGIGGKKVYTLEWLKHQAGLATGRA